MIKEEGEGEEEEELNSKKQKYDNELQLINSEIIEDLNNKDNLKILNNEKFKEIFFREYFLFYLINNDIKNEINNILDFIEYLYQLKNVSFNEFLLWFLNYSNIIDDMIQIYLILKKYNENILEEIKKLLNENKFKFEISHRNKEYMRILNEKFTFILESFIYIINHNFEKIKNFDDKQKEIYYNDLNDIYQTAFKIKNDLNLFLKELHSLKYILIIFNNLEKNNLNYDINLIIKFVELSNSETEAINNNDINFLIQNFDKEYDLLKQYINDQNILENILIMIYFEKYNKISSDEIRNKIFEFVFKKENLFLKSKILINYFLNNCFIPQQDDEDNNNDDEEDKFYFMNFLKEDNEILNIIETNINNNQSEKFILNFFETKLKEYFDTNEIDFN